MCGIFNDKGYITFRTVFWILFLSGAIYTAYLLLPPAAKHLMLKYEVEYAVKNVEYYTDAQMLKNILEKADSWYMPINESNVTIDRDLYMRRISVTVEYEVKVNFFNKYEWIIPYRIYKEKSLNADTGKVLTN